MFYHRTLSNIGHPAVIDASVLFSPHLAKEIAQILPATCAFTTCR